MIQDYTDQSKSEAVVNVELFGDKNQYGHYYGAAITILW